MNSVSFVKDLFNLSSSVSISSSCEETHLFFEKLLLNYQSCERKQKLADFSCIISAALPQLLFTASAESFARVLTRQLSTVSAVSSARVLTWQSFTAPAVSSARVLPQLPSI